MKLNHRLSDEKQAMSQQGFGKTFQNHLGKYNV